MPFGLSLRGKRHDGAVSGIEPAGLELETYHTKVQYLNWALLRISSVLILLYCT